MDLMTGLICLVVAIVSACVLYYISVSSMKEKTYDEVKAEQKKKAEEFLAQGRSAKEKAKDKKLKKAGKKVKEKTSTESVEVSSDEVETGKGHVAFVEPPIILDEEHPVIEEKKKKKNKKKEKPILINKDEITPVSDVPPSIINHFEQIIPKDDFSLKRSVSRDDVHGKPIESQPPAQKQPTNKQNPVQTNPLKEAKVEKTQKQVSLQQKPSEKTAPVVKASGKPGKVQEKPLEKLQEKQPVAQVAQKAVEEVVVKAPTKQLMSTSTVNGEHASPSIKANRKKRSDLATIHQMSGDKEAVNVSLLMPLVHKAELSRTEIQVLIDVLLNKQQDSSDGSAEWIEGRQDPVVKLKKQLAEKEKALAEELEAGVANQRKLRELRAELNQEKHTVRTLEETLTRGQAELVGLTSRLQHTADEKQGLVAQIQQMQAKLSEEHMVLCKLQEEQGQTQNAVQQELLAQRQQLEMHIDRLTDQHQDTIAALEGQLSQMASQLQEQETVNVSLGASASQSDSLARQVKELHLEIERLMTKSQYDTGRLQSELNSLNEQLNLKRSEIEKLTTVVQNVQAENNRLSHQVSSACSEAQQLRDENESLAAQVTAHMERPATEGRENGDHSYTETNSHSDKIHEKELLLEQLRDDVVSKEKEVNLFKTDLAQKEIVIMSLKTDLDLAHSNSEKMLKEICSYKCLVQEQESVINALREETESAHKVVNTLREDISKNMAEISRLSKDCATREQLESRESTIEKLTSELNTHKTKLADQGATIEALKKEIDRYKSGLEDKSKENKWASELNNYKTELTLKEAMITSLTAQVTTHQSDVEQLRKELVSSQDSVSKLSQQVHEFVDKQTSLSRDLDSQKLKNNEAEEKAKQEEQERTKQLLQRILPNISVDVKQGYDTWLETFVSKASAATEPVHNEGSEGDRAMLAEVERQNSQLQALVTHYKDIIADTEGMLDQLQSHVETEETRWGTKLHRLQAQLDAVTHERDKLQAGVKSSVSTTDGGSETN